ncbi:hypothetical protein D3C84_1043600 [compost metagenome]
MFATACFLARVMSRVSRAVSWIGLPVSHLVSATRLATFRRSLMVFSSGCSDSGAGVGRAALATNISNLMGSGCASGLMYHS